MRWQIAFSWISLLLFCAIPASLYAQAQPDDLDEIGPLPFELSPEKAAAWGTPQFSPAPAVAAPRRIHRHIFRPLKHPFTPNDLALRESVRNLGVDKHRFVQCELKDHAIVTGAITSIWGDRFFVRTDIMGSGRTIRYSQLEAPPRPVLAIGAHLKNGLEWTGLVGLSVALSPLVAVFVPLTMTGVIQD